MEVYEFYDDDGKFLMMTVNRDTADHYASRTGYNLKTVQVERRVSDAEED